MSHPSAAVTRGGLGPSPSRSVVLHEGRHTAEFVERGLDDPEV